MSTVNNDRINRLRPKEIAVLIAVYDSVDGSLSAHVSIEAIRSHLLGKHKYKVQPVVEKLVAKRYVREYPTGGGMTYQLQIDGKRLVEEIYSRNH